MNDFLLALLITCGVGIFIIALAFVSHLYDKLRHPKTKGKETGGTKIFVTVMMIIFSPIILLGGLLSFTLKGIGKILAWITHKFTINQSIKQERKTQAVICRGIGVFIFLCGAIIIPINYCCLNHVIPFPAILLIGLVGVIFFMIDLRPSSYNKSNSFISDIKSIAKGNITKHH